MPAALAVSAFVPWAMMPLLMLGGAYLCYEGFEKLAHKFVRRRAKDAVNHADLVHARSDLSVDLVSAEKAKIKGAVRTDFVLSAESIVITLSNVAHAPFATRVGVLVGIALIMTAGVYGLVGGIVKLDDVGLHLSRRGGDAMVSGFSAASGRAFSRRAVDPRGLSIVGTAAMFLVGGSILVHGIPCQTAGSRVGRTLRDPRHRARASTYDVTPARCRHRDRGRCVGHGRRGRLAARITSADGWASAGIGAGRPWSSTRRHRLVEPPSASAHVRSGLCVFTAFAACAVFGPRSF